MAAEEATRADFRAQFSEFASTSDTTLDFVLAEALQLNGVTKQVTLLYAAWILEGAKGIPDGQAGGGVGEITGELRGQPAGAVSECQRNGKGRVVQLEHLRRARAAA